MFHKSYRILRLNQPLLSSLVSVTSRPSTLPSYSPLPSFTFNQTKSFVPGRKTTMATTPTPHGYIAPIPSCEVKEGLTSHDPKQSAEDVQAAKYLFPAEWDEHEATILGFPSKISLSKTYLEQVRKEIVNLAAAISEFETVRLYTRPEEVSHAQKLLSKAKLGSNPVIVVPCPVNHVWVRDSGPVYVRDSQASKLRYAINFEFDEWGGKKPKAGKIWGSEWPLLNDDGLKENTDFAKRVIDSDFSPSPVVRLNPKIKTEGGGLITDGEGTLLITESCIVCDVRNPGVTRDHIEAELKRLLGVEKVIWFKGLRGKDITDCHVDAVARFVKPGVIVMSKPHINQGQEWIDVVLDAEKILSKETDAKGRKFEIHILDEPDAYDDDEPLVQDDEDEAVCSYVNYYHCNGGLIIPRFGNKEKDTLAFELLKKIHHPREVRQVHVNGIPLTGGGIHCVTQQIPAP